MCLCVDVCVCVRLWHGLAVPVVDLLDIAEDDFVFSSHVLWNPSDLQAGHEALRSISREHNFMSLSVRFTLSFP